MKTLIEIKRDVWGKVRDFATVKDLTVSNTVEHLLTKALNSYGYMLSEGAVKK